LVWLGAWPKQEKILAFWLITEMLVS